MPEMKHFKVSQTRAVKVTAHNIVDAVRIASAAFEHGQDIDNGVKRGAGPEGVWGNTDGRIEVTDISAYKE